MINPKAVREAREELNATQEVFADMLRRSCGRGTTGLVSSMERGTLSPRFANFWAGILAKITKKNKEFFLTKDFQVSVDTKIRK